MRITIKIGKAFYSEWIQSEVIDNFAASDIPLLRTITNEAIWAEHCFEDIFDFDLERVGFTICMLEARRTNSFAFVTFDETALAYVLHPESLVWQIEKKWAEWDEQNYVTAGYKVLEKLWDYVEGTELGDKMRQKNIQSSLEMSNYGRDLRER